MVWQVDGVPEQLQDYNVKSVWKFKNAERHMEMVLPESIIIELQKLTGCELIADLGNRQLFIGAYMEEDCSRLIGKLDNIWKHFKYSVYIYLPNIQLIYC